MKRPLAAISDFVLDQLPVLAADHSSEQGRDRYKTALTSLAQRTKDLTIDHLITDTGRRAAEVALLDLLMIKATCEGFGLPYPQPFAAQSQKLAAALRLPQSLSYGLFLRANPRIALRTFSPGGNTSPEGLYLLKMKDMEVALCQSVTALKHVINEASLRPGPGRPLKLEVSLIRAGAAFQQYCSSFQALRRERPAQIHPFLQQLNGAPGACRIRDSP